MGDIVFLSHGGPIVGMGHVIRCLSLAKEFRQKGKKVFFISKYAVGQQIILSEGFEVMPLVSKYELNENQFSYGSSEILEEDWVQIKKILSDRAADAIVVDSYNVEPWFFHGLKEYTKCLIYIDDLHVADYPVDVIINGNINAHTLQYPILENQKRLLGLSYNLIRNEFKQINNRDKEHQPWNRVLITTGASDPKDITGNILNYLVKMEQFERFQFKVVLGQAFGKDQNEKNISLYQRYSNIEFYEAPKKMSNLMKWADYAISAGGSTIYELFACGVIVLAFIYADNQVQIVTKASELGYLYSLGRYEELEEDKFLTILNSVMMSKRLNKIMVKKIQEVVDCKGTERCVATILELIEKDY